MKKTVSLLVLVPALAAGCRTAEVESVDVQPAPAVQPALPTADAIPASTLIQVELNQTLSTERNRVGDHFTASVVRPLVSVDGRVVVPRGAVVTGVITGLDDSDHVGDQAAIRIDIQRLRFGGNSYRLSAEVVDTELELEDEDDRVLEGAVAGAAAGAILGAIIEGDLEAVLIGGAIGAGAGTIISLGIGDVEAALPAGSEMTLRTTSHVSLK